MASSLLNSYFSKRQLRYILLLIQMNNLWQAYQSVADELQDAVQYCYYC